MTSQNDTNLAIDDSALEVYHVRRKTTHYMCGWDDLEREVARMIRDDNQAV